VTNKDAARFICMCEHGLKLHEDFKHNGGAKKLKEEDDNSDEEREVDAPSTVVPVSTASPTALSTGARASPPLLQVGSAIKSRREKNEKFTAEAKTIIYEEWLKGQEGGVKTTAQQVAERLNLEFLTGAGEEFSIGEITSRFQPSTQSKRTLKWPRR